jgi:hypothetical protein
MLDIVLAGAKYGLSISQVATNGYLKNDLDLIFIVRV